MIPRFISLFLLLIIAAGLLLVFSIGCTTAGRATRYFDAHADTASGYCANRYPVKTDSVVEVRVDSAAYNRFMDSAQVYTDSVLRAAQGRYNSNKTDLLAEIGRLQEKGDFTEGVAQELQNKINNIRPPDTAGLRASIEAQIRRTLTPCADSIKRITQENTARVAAETARADKYQGTAEEFDKGKKDPAIIAGWLATALFRKWYFWALLTGLVLFLTRKIWLKLII